MDKKTKPSPLYFHKNISLIITIKYQCHLKIFYFFPQDNFMYNVDNGAFQYCWTNTRLIFNVYVLRDALVMTTMTPTYF